MGAPSIASLLPRAEVLAEVHAVVLVEELRDLGREIEIRVDPARFRPSDKMHQRASTKRLRELTDWTPQVGIEEGLRRLLKHEGMVA